MDQPVKMSLLLFHAWTAVLLALSGPALGVQSCPATCTCLHGGSVVDCTDGDLRAVPSDLPRNVQVLILDNNRLGSIPDKAFVNLTGLSQLSLQNCNLSSVPEDALYGLNSLSSLTLAYNSLRELPANLIKAKDRLEYFSMSHNLITFDSISSVLAGLSQLHALDLKHIEIGDRDVLPETFASLTNLKMLRLNQNDLNVTETFFNPLSNVSLEYLSLIKTNLNSVAPGSFSPLTDLQTLDLSGAYVEPDDASRILQSFVNTSQLRTLNMNHVFNFIGAEIPKDFFKPLSELKVQNLSFSGNNKAFRDGTMPHRMFAPVHSLRTINLDHCALHIIPSNAFNHLNHLEKLSLVQNQLSCYRKDDCGFLHGEFVKLKVLDLSWNSIETTGTTMRFKGSTFKALDRLILRGNKMMILKTGSFKNLPITQLDLSENPINDIEQGWMEGLTDLRYLFLNGSRHLSTLGPKSFHGARRLQHIHLEQGGLETVHHGAFKGLHRLEALRLRENDLTDDALTRVEFDSPNITLIDLGSNNLTVVPDFVSGLNTLQQLFLDMNYINDTSTMSGPKSLKVLDLSYNLLTNISSSFFQDVLPNLVEVTFEYNPFYCGCGFENIKGLVAKKNIFVFNEFNHICHSPPEMRGVNIFDVHPSNWHCNVKHVMVPFFCVLFTCLAGGLLVLVMGRKPRCSPSEVEWPIHCCTNCYSRLKTSIDGAEFTEDQSGL